MSRVASSSAVLPAPPAEGSPYVRLPTSIWFIFGSGAVLGLTTANPWLTAAALLLLPVFISLLWRQGETPVLLFAVGYQWLQVTAKVFHADVLGVPVSGLSKYAVGDLPSVEVAVWLSLLGLLVLAVGMRVGMRRLKSMHTAGVGLEAASFSPERAFMLYLGGAVFSEVVREFAWVIGGLAQPLLALSAVKWVFFFVLGYVVLRRRERYPYFVAAVLIEFIGGIGFFSGFKTVLFVTLLVLFTVRYTLRPSTIISSTFILAALLVFGAAWTSVKSEYRAFLNQGTRTQSVVVSQGEQLEKLGEMLGQLTAEDISLAMEPLFERIAYVDYLALTLDYVPQYRPHEGGHVWLGSIRHVFMPRILFPSKPNLTSDSELTMRYTGLYLASDAEGTSISIGYMGESYVDFGVYGMFVPIFLLGLFWGYMYYFFMTKARFTILGYAFATALLLNAYQFEMASIKLLGGVLIRFIVLALVIHYFEARIAMWLQGRAAPVRAPRRVVADQPATS